MAYGDDADGSAAPRPTEPRALTAASTHPAGRLGTLVAALRDGEMTAESDPLRRGPWHWPALIVWAGAWYASKTAFGGQSWHFSVQGARLLLHGAARGQPAGGLDLFADYPKLQSGPLTFLLADPVTWLTGGATGAAGSGGRSAGLHVAEVLMTLLGILALFALERAAFALRPDAAPSRIRWTVLGGGAAMLPVWIMAGVYWAHFDDILALTFAALAVWAAARRRPVLLGLCVACSVDAKPWAAGFLALLFALPGRQRRTAVAVGLALVAAAWLPFVIADPHTVHAVGFTIPNARDSALRALGVSDPRTPSWDRPAQIVLGCLLGALAVWRGRWPAVLLLGACARLAIEPNDYPYYFAGAVVGALAWDLLAARRPAPLATLGVTALIFASRAVGASPAFYGRLKLLAMVVAAAAALFAPAVRTARPAIRPAVRPAVRAPDLAARTGSAAGGAGKTVIPAPAIAPDRRGELREAASATSFVTRSVPTSASSLGRRGDDLGG